MDWLEVKIHTKSEMGEALASILSLYGAEGCVIEDGKDIENFINHKTDMWDYVSDELANSVNIEPTISFYLSRDDEGKAILENIKTACADLRDGGAFGSLQIETKEVSDEDWENNWKEYYKPIEVGTSVNGEKLTIVPLWQEYEPEPNERLVRLDPGMAFGTGAHGTTLNALKLFLHYAGDKTVLDVGCGSGIIGISAAKLGATEVFCTDFDPMSVKVTGEMIAANNVENITKVGQGDLVANVTGKYDVVVANIVADIILRLLPNAKSVMKEDGIIIFSGIIDLRREELMKAIESFGFTILEEMVQDNWHAFACKIS